MPKLVITIILVGSENIWMWNSTPWQVKNKKNVFFAFVMVALQIKSF